MPNTTNLSLPYPQSSDTPDVPRDIQALANAIDTKAVRSSASSSAPGSPATGMLWYQTDTNLLLVYNGSAWVTANDFGLVKVIPTGATNGTVSADGTVTVNNTVSSVTVAGAFTSSYNSYKIIYTGGATSAACDLTFQLSGLTTGYYGFLIYGAYDSATVSGYNQNNGGSFYFGGGDANYTNGAIELDNPYLSKQTIARSQPLTSDKLFGSYAGRQGSTSSATGFVIGTTAGTMTGGTIRVYGYRN